MVEYSFDEARILLRKNLENAIANLKRFVRGLINGYLLYRIKISAF